MHRGLSKTILNHFKNNTELKQLLSRPLPKFTAPYDSINEGFGKLYAPKYQQPFIPVDGQGPWIKTSDDKIVYDTGGYGMLGFGHNPPTILKALQKPQVMANIMTPNQAQYNFMEAFRKHNRWCQEIFCLNSGSEGNSLALRIANTHCRSNAVIINLKGSFHGRTNGPAEVSDSSESTYHDKLANFDNKRVFSVTPNNLDELSGLMDYFKSKNIFVELMIMEPVMGEGNPGYPIEPEYYTEAYRMIKKQGGLMLIDSVQAGLRCTGKLSITDYPGFENAPAPDMECYSKAITGGQFPLSVLACGPRAQYSSGLYGNTLTANPRGLDVATTVLEEMKVYESNVTESGRKLHELLVELQTKYPTIINTVSSTGLLIALQLHHRFDYIDIERKLRINGLNCIHGGNNCIRLTPWFGLTEKESELIVSIMEEVLEKLTNGS